ncbi:hypothetical protein HanPI659440_Chr17g0665481 [Helianthus annuus]|nr:hypothetical protein HanPI659440_Chr17g0665481 [Helianthus annuus]
MPREIGLDPSRLAFSAESRYLHPLRVFGNGETTITDQDSIRTKALNFPGATCSRSVLVASSGGKHQLLTTIDQPFGLGVMDERLLIYRRETGHNYFVTDNDHVEEERSPVARVYRRGLPEWTPDVTNYLPRNLPQQECAIRCNLHGYLALPVFDMSTHLCVGVLELLTSSKYTSYAYEVQRLCNALQTVGLRTQQPFDRSILNVSQVFCKSDGSKKKTHVIMFQSLFSDDYK